LTDGPTDLLELGVSEQRRGDPRDPPQPGRGSGCGDPGRQRQRSANFAQPRPTATYRKVTGGFRSECSANLFAALRSVISTAKRAGIDAYQAIKATLRGQSVCTPG
jgi:hypothetical protein